VGVLLLVHCGRLVVVVVVVWGTRERGRENRRTHGFRIEVSGRASSIDVFPSFARKEEEKIRVFAGLFFTFLEKGVLCF
jgi:hypothetical protein